jgi:phospholipase C
MLAACGGSQSPLSPGGIALHARPASGTGSSNYISHIVVIVQENRTFDNLFATFPGADGATTGKWKNQTLKLRKTNLESCDFPHTRSAFLKDYNNGEMNGFGTEASKCYGKGGDPYQYVDPTAIAPYWDIAEQYVLADHMFEGQGSGSFSAHQYLIRGGSTIDAAQTQALIDFPTHSPWGCDAPKNTVTSLIVSTGKRAQRGGASGHVSVHEPILVLGKLLRDAARSARRTIGFVEVLHPGGRQK